MEWCLVCFWRDKEGLPCRASGRNACLPRTATQRLANEGGISLTISLTTSQSVVISLLPKVLGILDETPILLVQGRGKWQSGVSFANFQLENVIRM